LVITITWIYLQNNWEKLSKTILEDFLLNKTHTVHLKPEGEICNRLKHGTRVKAIKRKGDWVHITWRRGKKKGWINLSLEKQTAV
jgi:hypothetical protein